MPFAFTLELTQEVLEGLHVQVVANSESEIPRLLNAGHYQITQQPEFLEVLRFGSYHITHSAPVDVYKYNFKVRLAEDERDWSQMGYTYRATMTSLEADELANTYLNKSFVEAVHVSREEDTVENVYRN